MQTCNCNAGQAKAYDGVHTARAQAQGRRWVCSWCTLRISTKWYEPLEPVEDILLILYPADNPRMMRIVQPASSRSHVKEVPTYVTGRSENILLDDSLTEQPTQI